MVHRLDPYKRHLAIDSFPAETAGELTGEALMLAWHTLQ
jgi:hypothetical protein